MANGDLTEVSISMKVEEGKDLLRPNDCKYSALILWFKLYLTANANLLGRWILA